MMANQSLCNGYSAVAFSISLAAIAGCDMKSHGPWQYLTKDDRNVEYFYNREMLKPDDNGNMVLWTKSIGPKDAGDRSSETEETIDEQVVISKLDVSCDADKFRFVSQFELNKDESKKSINIGNEWRDVLPDTKGWLWFEVACKTGASTRLRAEKWFADFFK